MNPHTALMPWMVVGCLALPAMARASPPNPFRGQNAPQGQALYNQHCAQCHGTDARQPLAEAPDLRRLNSACNRLADHTVVVQVNPVSNTPPVADLPIAALRQRCLHDVDTYFLQSVLDGKVRAGVVHMPPWRDRLDEVSIWAIRSFIEVQPLPTGRRETSVDKARAAGP